MKRLLLVLALSVFVLLGRAAQAQAAREIYIPFVCGRPAAADAPCEVVRLINAERAASGLAPLTRDVRLDAAAGRHAADMAAGNYCGHTGTDGSTAGERISAAGYIWSVCGEVVATGHETPAEVVAAWLASPGHRAALLSTRFVHVGAAHTIGEDPGDAHYWAVDLAAY